MPDTGRPGLGELQYNQPSPGLQHPQHLLQPLFPQGDPAQQRYQPWPASYDAHLRISWRQIQPADPRTLPPDAPDDRKFDFSVIDDALAKLADRNMRLTLRVFAYNSCCDDTYPNNTNSGVPDWVRATPGATTNYANPPTGPAAGVTQVVPNWNDPNYLHAFEQLLGALGRRYDRDERLSVFEFSGYGDWSQNHNAYVSTVLGAPIPQNSGLASIGADWFINPDWKLLAKFDGEFASHSNIYAGSVALRHSW